MEQQMYESSKNAEALQTRNNILTTEYNALHQGFEIQSQIWNPAADYPLTKLNPHQTIQHSHHRVQRPSPGFWNPVTDYARMRLCKS